MLPALVVDCTRSQQAIAHPPANDTAQPARQRQQLRDHGQFFTPPALVDFVTNLALTALAPTESASVGRSLRILDPSCGDGRFLQSVERQIAAQHQPPPTLIGFERQADLAALSSSNVPQAQIVCAESLMSSPQLEPVDVVIGNPPYLRSVALRRTDPALWQQLRGAFAATSVGEWDLYGGFIEKSLQWLAPSGVAALIVPSRWFTAAFAKNLRAVVGAHVVSIIDFGSTQLFTDATTYSSIVVLRKRRLENVDSVEYVCQSGKTWSVHHTPRSQIETSVPWRFQRSSFAPSRRTLGDVAQLAKGTGTNADPIFVMQRLGISPNGTWSMRNGFGVVADLEPDLLVPVARGRDIGKSLQEQFCLLPYQRLDNGNKYVLLAADQLQQRWPLSYQYLQNYQGQLSERERGRFAGQHFYCFGRPQNLAFHLEKTPKVTFPDVTTGGRATLDSDGTLLLDSAYAARPRPTTSVLDIHLLYAILCSPAIAIWLGECGIPLRGGYLRMKTAYLSSLPIPDDEQALLAAAGEAKRGNLAASHAILMTAWGLVPSSEARFALVNNSAD
jgi:hypothetical protein